MSYLYLFFATSLMFGVLIPESFALALNVTYPFLPANPSAPVFIAWLYKFALGSVGIVALLVLIWGGIHYIVSGARPESQKEAKEWIGGAIFGLVLLLASSALLFMINPNLITLGVRTLDLGDASDEALKLTCIQGVISSFGASVSAAGSTCGCSLLSTGFTPVDCFTLSPPGPFGLRSQVPVCIGNNLCVIYREQNGFHYQFCCSP